MPTLEELQADINTAISLGDVPELRRFEGELRSMDSPRSKAVLKNITGSISRVQMHFDAALEDFNEAHARFKELGDDQSVAAVSVNIGIIHAESGNFPEGLARFQEAVRIHRERGNTRLVANITTNIGVLLERCGDVKGALKYLQEALLLRRNTLGEKLNQKTGNKNLPSRRLRSQ